MNATHLSPRSQNEIIGMIGYDVIRANIVAEVKQAKFLLMKSAVIMLSIDHSVFALLILEKSLLHLQESERYLYFGRTTAVSTKFERP